MTQPCCLSPIRLRMIHLCALALLSSSTALFSQDNARISLLENLDPAAAAIAGTWSLTDGELQVTAQKGSRIALRGNMPLDYDVELAFTRNGGDNSIGVILPVGNVSPALELSAWQGEAHGLSRVNQLSARDDANPAAVKPGTLENGRRYLLQVEVRAATSPATITAKLDRKPLFSWSGSVGDLEPNFVMNLPTTRTIGLSSQENPATFHKVTMLDRSAPAPARMTPAPQPPASTSDKAGAVDLSGLSLPGTPGWELFNGAAFTAEENVVSSNPGAGSGDRGAYLEDVIFSEGTIEVELRGAGQPQSSFIGIVIHGEDGETYDSVYFRPFNFGNPDPVRRGHAVQYMSHPDFPWRQLRTDRPEEFENPASPEPQPDEWFTATIEVKGGRIRTFVNGAAEPCLDVEKLSETSSGKVGLWFNGIASFRNLTIENE